MNRPSQFTFRSLLIWIGAFAVFGGILRRYVDCNAELIFWCLTIVGAGIFRVPGSWIGGTIGTVGRHAVGWFASFIGGTLVIFAINQENLPKEFWDGVFVAALFGGIFVATMIELPLLLLRALLACQHGVAAEPGHR